jgi:hypothetical protein
VWTAAALLRLHLNKYVDPDREKAAEEGGRKQHKQTSE